MRLIDCFSSLVSYALHPGTLSSEVDGAEVHDQFVALAGQCTQYCQQNGFSSDQAQQALFAISVWIDEQRLTNPELEAWWLTYSLQHRFFNTTNGGDEFYQRFSAIDENDYQTREVYEYCLRLGFRGNMFEKEEPFDEFCLSVFGCTIDQLGQDPSSPLFPESYGSETAMHKKNTVLGRSFLTALFVLFFSVGMIGGLFLLGQKSLEAAYTPLKTLGL